VAAPALGHGFYHFVLPAAQPAQAVPVPVPALPLAVVVSAAAALQVVPEIVGGVGAVGRDVMGL